MQHLTVGSENYSSTLIWARLVFFICYVQKNMIGVTVDLRALVHLSALSWNIASKKQLKPGVPEEVRTCGAEPVCPSQGNPGPAIDS